MTKGKVKVLRSRRFNVVHLIFFLFFIYMVIMVGRYIAKEDIKVCEVTEGSLTQNHNYTGLILRTETIVYADTDGYVKCYVNDGDRINTDGVIFAIDKTGDNLQPLSSGTQSSITDEQYRSLRKYLNHFSTKYKGQDFTDVYTFKDQLTTTLYGIEQQEADTQESDSDFIMQKAAESGVISFKLDGFESLSEDDITRESLGNIAISNTRVLTGDEVQKGTAICKILSDEEWSVMIPITDADAAYYADKTSATILLNDINTKTKAGIQVYEDSAGEKLAKLTLDNYMSSYESDRMISFQLVKPVVSGLKVPKTCVVSNDLYVIPVEYAVKQENSSGVSFIRMVNDESGEDSREVLSPSISYVDNSYYYIDDSQLQSGDVILKVDTDGNVEEDAYTVGAKKALQGVYNVNKGYAIFEVVDILDENDSYCIVKGGTTYGLAVYDHIVLNAVSIDEDDLLY